MLKVNVLATDGFDDSTQSFVKVDSEVTLELEHSLFSLSKWEMKWEIPFLSSDDQKTNEQTMDYISCMSATEIPQDVLVRLTNDNIKEINDYIQAKMTATWITETKPSRGSSETITSELIYYWMVALQIDWQAQYWHLNRLLMLVRVINEKNKVEEKKKPVTQSSLAARRQENERRKQQLKSRG